MKNPTFNKLIPGNSIEGDWYKNNIPENIRVGQNCFINSSHCFHSYYSQLKVGMTVGNNCSFYQTAFAVEESGFLEIGNECHFSNVSLVVSKHISIGNNVIIAGGVTVVDSNFHPINPKERINDISSLSPSGNRDERPNIESKKVVIENDVWIGFNATIMSGVTLGKGSIIEPGSVVIKSVKAGQRVEGNPAKEIL